jgi:hypothetical protein
MNTKSYSQIIFLLIIFLIQNTLSDQLRWAFEIFRHGARTPYSGMTKNFTDCFGQQWDGLKELTGVGLRQHFLVGYRNRIKYIQENKLISDTYDPREVFLISTDSNRTIMSANAQVQGLFIPSTGPKILPNQSYFAVPPVKTEDIDKERIELDNKDYTALPDNMNVIPVHSFFNADHFIQLQDKKVCPKTIEYYNKNQKRDEVVNFLNEMTKKYGEKLNETLIIPDRSVDVLKDYTKAYYIFDTIICRYTEGYKLPDLGVPDEELLKDSFKFFELDLIGNGINNDSEICIHAMSPIFNRLLEWIDNKIDKDMKGDVNYTNYDIPKFVMFSAHDSTCAAFMGFMKEVFKTESRYPAFATNINLELYRKNEEKEARKEDYYIQYIINDELISSISYDNFTKTLKQRMKTMDEVNEFCGFNKKDEEEEEAKKRDKIYLGVDIGLGVISLVLIIVISITAKKTSASKVKIDSMADVRILDDTA